MKSFSVLFRKECLGFWRSKKLIWLPVVFMLLSVMQPITYYFMDDILKLSGSLPEGTVFEIAKPGGAEVMASVLSQLNTIGILLVIAAAMGAISDERKKGVLVFLLVRPVNKMTIAGSKMAAYIILISLSFMSGYLLSAYYTFVLFDSIQFNLLLNSMLMYTLYLFFVISVVLFMSAILDSNGLIAGMAALFIGGLSVISDWFDAALAWSPTRMSAYAINNLVDGQLAEPVMACVFCTIFLIVVLLCGTAFAIERKAV
ncbi:MAG: ABC transporter permease [Bacillus sp. (in: firmicutes)]